MCLIHAPHGDECKVIKGYQCLKTISNHLQHRGAVTYLPTYQPTYLPLNTVPYSHRPVVKRYYSCWGSFDCPHEWYLYSLPLPAEKGEMASSPAVSVQLPSPLITTSSHTSSLHVILALAGRHLGQSSKEKLWFNTSMGPVTSGHWRKTAEPKPTSDRKARFL